MDDILLFQILPRLPARSICRFMSVCKRWHSFLTSPMFTNHVHDLNQPKLLAVSATNPCKYFGTIDCEKPEVGLSAKRPLPFEADIKSMWIISSLNGLLCVGIDYSGLGSLWPQCYSYSDMILWNPFTGDYKKLSKDNSHANFLSIHARGYGLYYSSCDDDYKLLRVSRSSNAYIYSWKSESWRKAKSRVDSLLNTWNYNCFLNEKLYFVAQGTHGGTSEWCTLVIRFDTKTEMFTKIATPSSFAACLNVTVVGGCIHLCVVSKIALGEHELWKMDGDGEWTKVIRSSMSKPCHLMKNGNWLDYSGREVFVYKGDRKEAKAVGKYTIDNTMVLLINGKFVETIVSLKS